MSVHLAVLLLAAYLMGTIPFGLIVSRLKGVDIRKQGSGNYGATNVGRVIGRPWGLLVLALDIGKGVTTLLAARWACDRFALPFAGASETAVDAVLLGAGACCVIGNTAPFYLGFKGGKGVATSLGVILGIWPLLTIAGLLAFALWAVVTKVSGYVSLGSICAAIALPLLFCGVAWYRGADIGRHWPLLLLTLILALVILIRHRANISRLMSGTEHRKGKPA
jgi:acyl phosphate:glycerol-3-phosphate acyltransferase